MSLTADFLVKLTGNEQNSAATPLAVASHNFDEATRLINGVADGQADLVYSARSQIPASGSDTIDLHGTLQTMFGGTLDAARLKALLIKADAANAHDVSLGVPAVNGLADLFGAASQKIIVKPAGTFLIMTPGAGYVVTAATGDLLEVANEGGASAVNYDLYLIAASA